VIATPALGARVLFWQGFAKLLDAERDAERTRVSPGLF